MNQADNNGDTPLLIASQNGYLEIVEILIASGGLVNQADNNGKTPLYIASAVGHLEVVKVLIASGGSVNEADNDGSTPLHIASELGHLEIVKVLIANKADFLYKNKNGQTPLDVATTNAIKEYIINHPWYRRRSLILARPHSDHETNKEHKLKPLGEIMTATPGSVSDPNSHDSILFQLKIKIASFL